VQIHVEPTAYQNYNIPLFVWGAGLPAGADLYSLTTNRFDPALTRPDYNSPTQPLRNGDTGNLALQLLGLGPIPGSSMIPNVTLQHAPEPASAALLAFGGLAGLIFWRRCR
jgi:hypothetical protein